MSAFWSAAVITLVGAWVLIIASSAWDALNRWRDRRRTARKMRWIARQRPWWGKGL